MTANARPPIERFVPNGSIKIDRKFGIARDCSWGQDTAKRGVAVCQFAPSIDNPTVTDDPRPIFAEKRISGWSGSDRESFASLVAQNDKRNSDPNIQAKMYIEMANLRAFRFHAFRCGGRVSLNDC